MNWRALVLAGLLLALVRPLAAGAEPSATLHGGSLAFFSDTLRIVARNGATLQLADGTSVSGATAFIDLRTDKVVVAGSAQLAHAGTTLSADAIAIDPRNHRLDVLTMEHGVERVDPATGVRTAAPDDAASFDFPDVDDKHAYILSRTAEIVTRTSVRFLPAKFPTSIGAAPVPMYMYTYAVSNGFSATSLSGARFDQPYGIFSSTNALTAVHFRLENGGPGLGLQQNLIGNNDAFIAASADIATHYGTAFALNGYTRVGELSTITLNTGSVPGYSQGALGGTRAFGSFTALLNYTYNSGRYQTVSLGLRSRNWTLPGGSTVRVTLNTGLISQPGGLLAQLPDATQYTTLWQHGYEVFLGSPLLHGPLGTTLSGTVDDAITFYSFPHHYNTVNATAQASRRLSRLFTLFLGYNATWTKDVYPDDQFVFYPPTTVPLPNGGTYFGYTAFEGYSTLRLANFDVQYTPNPTTIVRISYQTADDFPQYEGYGRPPDALSLFVQFRPFPNIGLAIGRTYNFGWGGAYWLPTWTFSIQP